MRSAYLMDERDVTGECGTINAEHRICGSATLWRMRLNAMLHTILWGVFCACSWTWCIGMYLPRIMIERWGWPGFLVFAVPNVIGCAAMGYVVKSAARSREIGSRHGRAMIAFSIVTIAYHAFFLTWFFSLPLANIETSAAFEAGSTQWMMMKALPILLS
ncbi:MAG TPA: hypothetical protein VG711_05310, partial [Phycisphaerales bacterium]|nr:hypothetical protein [Phycisphaerales bacterium]